MCMTARLTSPIHKWQSSASLSGDWNVPDELLTPFTVVLKINKICSVYSVISLCYSLTNTDCARVAALVFFWSSSSILNCVFFGYTTAALKPRVPLPMWASQETRSSKNYSNYTRKTAKTQILLLSFHSPQIYAIQHAEDSYLKVTSVFLSKPVTYPYSKWRATLL